MDYWIGAVEYVGIAVGLMSGILSIFREGVLLYHSDRIPPKSLFWTSVRITFIISAVLAWYGEHHKFEQASREVEQLRAKDLMNQTLQSQIRDQQDTINRCLTQLGTAQNGAQQTLAGAQKTINNLSTELTRFIPAPVVVAVKTFPLRQKVQAFGMESDLWLITASPSRDQSPVKGIISCQHSIGKLVGTAVMGQGILIMPDFTPINDKQIRIRFESPVWNYASPFVAVTANPSGALDPGGCAFSPD